MTAYARQERRALSDLLAELGPDAPTLCRGWLTYDLAAHLVVRERRPDAGPALLVRPLRGWTRRVQQAARSRYGFAELLALLRRPPWWSHLSNPLLHEAANVLEFFVHHEDVRRAQPDWTPRDLPDGLHHALWRRLRGGLAKLLLRRVRAKVVLAADGFGEVHGGRGEQVVRLSGPPGELVLFCMGRQGVARVDLDGPADIVERLRTARLGF